MTVLLRCASALFLSLGLSVAVFAQQADLSVAKSGPGSAFAGEQVAYGILVTNNGPDSAASVSVDDTIPPGMSFVSASQNTGPAFVCSNPLPNTVNCTIATLVAGATASFTFVFEIENTAVPDTEYENTVTVSSTTPDPNNTNNTSVATTTVAGTADLAVFKTGPDTAPAGSQVSYTVTLTNNGPHDSETVKLEDAIPPGMTFISATQDTGPAFLCVDNALPPEVECTISLLGAGLSATFTFVFEIDPQTPDGTSFSNVATASAATFDPNEENNSAVVVTSTPLPQQGDMVVTKSGPTSAPPGANVVYTITLTNNGPSAATDVELEDVIPGDMTFVSFQQNDAPAQAMSCSTGGTITCTAASFPAGDTATFTLTTNIPGQTPPGTVYTNEVEVTSTNDPSAENDSASTTLTVATVDVSVVKIGPAAINAGTDVAYTLTVSNSGPDFAVGVVLTDELPPGTTLVSFTQNNGPAAVCSGPGVGTHGTVSCTMDLPDDSSAQFSLVINADDSTSITNTATVTSDSFDTNNLNNSSSVNTTVTPQADLEVTKSGPPTATAGSDVTYTVTLTNNGPSTAANVSLSDPVPAGTTFVSAVQNAGPTFTCDTTINCTIATLPAGSSASFTFVVHVSPSASGSIDNTATASTTTNDPAGGNNSSMVSSPVVASANTAVVKSGPAAVAAGANITYTVTVSNAGPSDAANLTLTDVLPANTTYVSHTQNSGPTFSCLAPGGTITCTLAVLPPSVPATFTFVYTVSPAATGTVDNTATLTSTTPDPTATNNTSTTSAAIGPNADVSVTKSGPASVTAGSNITYTVVVANGGPSVASNVTLTDNIPPNATFVSANQNSGPAFNCVTPAGQIVCTIASLSPATSATFTFVMNANANASVPVANTATVSSTTLDPDPANNTATSTAAIDPGPTDLSITKTANGERFGAGASVTYTIVVTNNGPSVAFGTTVTDVLPAGTTLQSATPSQGSCTGTTTVVCSLGTLAPASSATVTLVVRLPSSPGQVSNTASVTALNADSNGTNNASTSALAVVSEIPSLSTYGLMLLGLMLAGAAMIALRT